ncbi:MAG: hypothetical protein Q9207_000256 [Kuettlingeria erythrocarpa]
MHCNVCQRPSSIRLQLNCPACARDVLYQSRFLLAHILHEQEAASSQAEQKLKESRIYDSDDLVRTPSVGHNNRDSLLLHSICAQSSALEERTREMVGHAKALHSNIFRIRDQITSRRASNLKRRSDLTAAKQKVAQQEALKIAPLVKGIGRLRNRWDILHAKTAQSRLLLCTEAASLYGLQKRSKRKSRSNNPLYVVGGLPIYDLRDLNGASPDEVTTVNSILAHFVHLISHYLSLRLPAEITLPHRDHPLPTILPPASSYISLGVPLMRPAPSSSSNSPSASRALITDRRPRSHPLYLKKQLSVLAKDDAHTYSSFVEGTTLLAWDIAWLCRTQGHDLGDKSWDDICDVGHNLWRLVAAEQAEVVPSTPSPDHQTKQGLNADPQHVTLPTARDNQQGALKRRGTTFGQWSHDTAHSNLTGAAGLEHMRGWRLQDPLKVIDRVKHMLISDRTGAGWEILEGNEWETAPLNPESATSAAVVDASTIMLGRDISPRNAVRDPNLSPLTPDLGFSQDKSKGTSGWTKLKSR